jgi:putative colanic acid biosynthesis glycosyltransferase
MTPAHGPWLTIATVVFNDSPGLKMTVESVSEQNTELFEHVIIDGASTDGTAQLAQLLAKDRAWLRVVSESDRGIYNAMNKAITQARGEYVLFLNAGDDFCSATAVSDAHADWQQVHYEWGRYLVHMVDAQRNPTRPVDFRSLDPARFDKADQDPHHQGAVMSTQMLRDLGGFDERYRIVADYELMRRALRAGYRPWESGRVLTCVDASGVSTSAWRDSIAEVHRVRTAGEPPLHRLGAAVTTLRRTVSVGARRSARRAIESAVGTGRFHRLRGLPHTENSAESSPGANHGQ